MAALAPACTRGAPERDTLAKGTGSSSAVLPEATGSARLRLLALLILLLASTCMRSADVGRQRLLDAAVDPSVADDVRLVPMLEEVLGHLACLLECP